MTTKKTKRKTKTRTKPRRKKKVVTAAKDMSSPALESGALSEEVTGDSESDADNGAREVEDEEDFVGEE